ncbi:hypothetical protein BDDG_06195 [Blastomyces dermatitidis ATCC 18188]|uniref:Uncharacterized protein n=1 Tax=Ajellomyces dermatitidis (strain ATCC 18188 / CBS 674.68) TaxID=653446 RepID=F2TJ38_AJEDA|nr:hypothetical protein BDDG_06195 [Blastomyces dermatitidis ATCC 18188]
MGIGGNLFIKNRRGRRGLQSWATRKVVTRVQVPAGWGCGAMLVVHAGNYRIGGSDKSVSCLLPTTKTMADVMYHVSAYIPILKDLT